LPISSRDLFLLVVAWWEMNGLVIPLVLLAVLEKS
jgi:hypothetical protein